MTRLAVPKHRIKGRWLAFYFVAAMVVSFVVVGMIRPFWLLEDPTPALPEALSVLLWYSVMLGFLLRAMRKNGISIVGLLAPPPEPAQIRWAAAVAAAVFAASLALLYVLYLPLSYVWPEFTQVLLIDASPPLFWTGAEFHLGANAIQFVAIVLLGPFVEELTFRGLLLPSWAERWGPTRALVVSSLCFAALHLDPLGTFAFSVVVSLVFLKTGSLWLPVIIHSVNNGLVWVITAGEILVLGEQTGTLADFQDQWWMGVVGLLIGVPLLLKTLRSIPESPAASQGGGSVADANEQLGPQLPPPS